mgnify:FL=1
MNNRFSKLVQSFLTSYIIGECNYSMNTKASYSTTFYLFTKFMNDIHNVKPNNIEIESINKSLIIEFLDYLETERDASVETRNQRLACIKSFFKFVQINEPDLFETCTLILSIKNKKVPNKIISHFSEEEIKIIINYLNDNKELKKLTMICVLYETGARVSEFINIKHDDLNMSENASITLYGKGGKVRIVPISQELVKLINKYLKEVYIDYGENYLFYSNYKRKFSRSSINKIISKLVEELTKKYPNYFNKNYTPHSFRHTKATHLYNNGTPLLYIKDFLGHSTIISTEIYATPDVKKQREEILKNSENINIKNKYNNKKKESLDNWLKNNMK